MRNSKLVAFLLALVLCVVSVAAALADFNDVSEEWIEKMEKKACTILKNEGNNIDYKTLKEVSGSYYGNEYTFFLTSAKGKQYAAAFNEKGNLTHLNNYEGIQGQVKDVSKLDSKTMEKIEKKINSFLKANNPSLKKKIGKLVVSHYLKDGKTTYVEITDKKNKVDFYLKINSSGVRITMFNAFVK